MAYGIIGYAQPGALSQPSGSIFGDCKSYQLIDESLGVFFNDDFDNFQFIASPQIGGVPAVAFGHAVASTAQLADGNFDSALKVTVGANAADGFAIFTRPLGASLNSGQKLWVEANVAFNNATGSLQGGFVGFVCGPVNQQTSSTAVTVQAGGVPANTGTSATDAKAGILSVPSNTLTSNTVSTTSLFGILITPRGAGDQLILDAVYLNQPAYSATPTALPALTSTNTSTGAVVWVAQDLLNQTGAITANLPQGTTQLGQLSTSGSALKAYTAPSTTLTTENANALINFGFIKLGVRFDGSGKGGYGTVYFYVNGVQIASAQVNNTWDTISDYAAIVNYTGFASGIFFLDFFRAAGQAYIP